LYLIRSWNTPSGNWLKGAEAMAPELSSKYISHEYRNSPLGAQQTQRKRSQKFQTVFSPGFLQCFIVQFLCLKARTSHYSAGSTKFNARPLSNESLTLSLQGAFLYGVITAVGLHLKYA